MICPPALKKGSKVALVSTARKVDAEGLEKAAKLFSEHELELVFAPNLRAECNQFAGTDEQRRADFQWAINHPEIEAIVCYRGGYGTVRIIDKIDFSPLQKNPKWICGYSDVTVLHARLTALGINSLHSTMPVNFSTNTPAAISSFFDALFGNFAVLSAPPHPFNRNGVAQGELTGGNLSILYSLQGSKDALQTDGKILFLEDLDEYLYHIDRMMQNLRRSGMLHNLAGLIIGGMTDMRDNTVPYGKTAEEIIQEAVAEFGYPVCFGFPAGHIADNCTLVMGKKIRLEVSSTTSLTYL
jgi:muramoyltetrapeptide carboxypeptidase